MDSLGPAMPYPSMNQWPVGGPPRNSLMAISEVAAHTAAVFCPLDTPRRTPLLHT
jgi:hypothetical protein